MRWIEMQKCPKCHGQGTVSKPPYVPGNVFEWTSSSISFVCDVCNGAKIIPMHESVSPSNEVKEPNIENYKLRQMVNELLFMPAFTDFGANQYLEKHGMPPIDNNPFAYFKNNTNG